MKIECFTNTDPLLVELSSNEITETRDLDNNTLVEFDSSGRLVSMMIEHAKEQANMEEFVFYPSQRTENNIYKVEEEAPEYKMNKASE